MTSFDVVYDAFLSKILEDEWEDWDENELRQDLFMFLQAAVMRFKFPRVSLEYTKCGFTADLTNDEIQILASYMKCEWLDRSIMTWENVKPLYEERDFSQANLLDKLKSTLDYERINAARLEGFYYRSINGKSYQYSGLAGS